MFDAIAARYDRMNRILSFGIDGWWRRAAVRALELPEEGRALDVATGTADVAITIARRYPRATIIGIDPSTRMLEVGRAKLARKGLSNRVSLELGDAERLALETASFDGVTIAFGIRNVPDRLRALREMARVLRPGGRLVVLELGEPEGSVLGAVARAHVHAVVPRVGAALAGAREYKYLAQSIGAFPKAHEFSALMREAGLDVLVTTPLTLGVARMWVGTPAGGAP
jgi:demethylmenaquinone methyltransferase/2-methoxy-6-polyprenyl-1,4-benzoquinol methylase